MKYKRNSKIKSSKWKLMLCLMTVVMLFAACEKEVSAATKPYEKICTKEEWEVLIRTNKERLKEGLEPYSTFPKLQAAGDKRAKEICSCFSHERPDGTSCFTVLNGIGNIYTMGENIAAGYKQPKDVVNGWMNSSGHKANILYESFTHMGVGYEKGGSYGTYWVQLFIGTCQADTVRMDEKAVKQYKKGTSIEQMERYLVASCAHGECYIPVTEEMCTGYNKNKTGLQTIKVSYQGKKVSFQVKIGEENKPNQVTGIKVKKVSKNSAVISFNKIKNASGYEVYMKEGEGSYKKVKNLSGASKTKYVKKGLKKGGKYTFKVRAYRKIGNKKYIGPFSRTKSVTP